MSNPLKPYDDLHGTTVLCVRKDNQVIMAADGQISLGNVVLKAEANKIRSIMEGKIVAGFAGSTADAITLFERLENKLASCNDLLKSAISLAKDWRTDKYLRRLEALMIVADKKNILVLTGQGDVIKFDDIAAIGSGGFYALAAARALIDLDNVNLTAKDIASKAMHIAADICVYSNHNIRFEEIKND